MIDDNILRHLVVLLKAQQRMTLDAEDVDDCRHEGRIDGFIEALNMVIEGNPWCPCCGESPKDYEFHTCYPEEEGDHICQACGEGNVGFKHGKTCKELR